MKSGGILRHLVIAFLIAIVVYAVFFFSIENIRTRKGPWQVTFDQDTAEVPALTINHPTLAITNIVLTFPEAASASTNLPLTMLFGQARPVPFDVPFGQCIFQDTTFLPGTVTFNLFGHEIELLPRVLIIDKKEHNWTNETLIPVTGRGVVSDDSTTRTNASRQFPLDSPK